MENRDDYPSLLNKRTSFKSNSILTTTSSKLHTKNLQFYLPFNLLLLLHIPIINFKQPLQCNTTLAYSHINFITTNLHESKVCSHA